MFVKNQCKTAHKIYHYFMHCPLYNIHRQQLVDSFNELNVEFTIQTILYGSEISDYNQNVKLFRAVHSFIKRSKRFDNNIVI
jgi:arginine/ornithine N-succinyltransferase beta subunit